MKKYEYRCDRCMTIEERWILYADKPPDSIFCHKCDGVALMHSRPKSKEKVYEKKIKRNSKISGRDRRSGKDRRKSPVGDYFLNGYVERRSGSERRFLWYMTM